MVVHDDVVRNKDDANNYDETSMTMTLNGDNGPLISNSRSLTQAQSDPVNLLEFSLWKTRETANII